MNLITVQAAWRDYRLNSIPVDHVINVGGEPEYPYNHRAILMSDMWDAIKGSGAAGVLWLTCDIVLDPSDLEAMAAAVGQLPEDVHTGLVKLWPVSTGHTDWIWSHRGGTLGAPTATQDDAAPVTYFSMDCLWAPRRLLDLAFPAGRVWVWNAIDVHLSEIALEHGIPAHVVPGCQPKHLHF